MPTFCSLSAFEPKSDLKWDGIDISDLLIDRKPLPQRAIYTAGPRWRESSLRLGDYKLITRGSGDAQKVELYNIAIDPSEQNDLSKHETDLKTNLLEKLKSAAAADRDSVAGKD